MKRILALTFALPMSLLPAGALHASSSGLLPNPDFHDPEGVNGVEGWTELFPLVSEMNVIADDADGCIDSGAADAINTSGEDAGNTTFVGCTNDVVAGTSYRVTGAVRFPFGTDPSEFSAALFFHAAADCLGGFVGTGAATNTEYASETTTDWTDFRMGPATAPVGAQSIGVRIFLIKDLGTDNVSDLYFDRIYLTTADFVFAEDFERGSACRWSLEVGIP